ncbi:MAG TPA: ABC transporter permease, partial [Cyclobacteriaceae bacterium]
MWRYYLKLAYRNLHRRKVLSIVNISGLTVAMTCSIFTFLFIKDELSFETVHVRASQIYRIAGNYEHGNSEGKTPNALTNFQLGPKLKAYFPEIQEIARIHIFDGLIQYKHDKHFERKMCFADNSLFKIFSFELLGAQNPLSKPNTVVISQSVAERYFGSQNPFGKVI